MPRSSVLWSLAAPRAVVVALVAVAGCSSSSSGPGGGGGVGSCTLAPASTLAVVQVVPANAASGVFVGSDVSVRFNTCLDPATVTATNIRLASLGFVAGSLGYDASTATVTFHPSAHLAYDTA